MKNNDLFELKEVINQVKNAGSTSFKLSVMINEEILDDRIKIISKQNVESDEIKEYSKKAQELGSGHAEKDETGAIILYEGEGGNGKRITQEGGRGFYNITSDVVVYEKAKSELDIEYKEVIEGNKTKYAEFLELLNQEASEIRFVKFDISLLPDLEYNQIKVLKVLLNL